MKKRITHLRKRLHFVGLAGMVIGYITFGTLILAFDTQIQIGDVAEEDIFAPESIVYESEVETELVRLQARDSVEPVYNRVANAGTEQVALAQAIIDYINLVRQDPTVYATQEQKLHDLQAIEALKSISVEVWLDVLNARNDDWNRIAADIVDVLNRAMRVAITPDGMEDAREQLDSRVDSSFSDEQRNIVITIVGELLVPNRVLDEAATAVKREAVMATITPQLRSFEQGEIVVSRGEPIEEEDIEALQQFGLIGEGGSNWRGYIGAFLMFSLLTGVLLFYLREYYPYVLNSESQLIMLGTLILGFLGGAKLFSGSLETVQNLFPGAALALVIATLIGPHLGVMTVVGLAMLVATMVDNSLEFAIYIGMGGVGAVLGLRHLERLNAYVIAGLGSGVVNAVVLSAFEMTENEQPATLVSLLSKSSIGILNGLFAAVVAMGILLVISNVMNLATSFKLNELMQPNQPLLRRLLRETPGTYQHSLQVSNLAEQATERIGGNSNLVRVAAMYHDIGKMLNPQFFIENQASGINPHDLLDNPWQSAKIIIDHVIEGDRMARRYKLPTRIRDFIREHHGTTMPMYFYQKALERVGGDASRLKHEDFVYLGPPPQSRETAIVMLADGIESTARARKPQSEKEIVDVVDFIMENHLQNGQLDESHLTLNDLKAIREVFIETLQGIYHTRIAYPEPLKTMVAKHEALNAPSAIPTALPEKVPTATQEFVTPKPEVVTSNGDKVDKGETVSPKVVVATETDETEKIAAEDRPTKSKQVVASIPISSKSKLNADAEASKAENGKAESEASVTNDASRSKGDVGVEATFPTDKRDGKRATREFPVATKADGKETTLPTVVPESTEPPVAERPTEAMTSKTTPLDSTQTSAKEQPKHE